MLPFDAVKARDAVAPSEAAKLLLVQTGFIGDVILSTPVFSELRKRYPRAKITLLTTPAAAPLVRNHPDLDAVVIYDKRGKDRGLRGVARMARRLRAEQFDAVFSLHKSHRTALLLTMTGIAKRYGFQEAALSFLYSARATRKEYAHEVQRNLALLKPLGVDPSALRTPMQLQFSEEVLQQAAVVVPDLGKKRIALAPGSVWATKRWTAAGFARVAAHFQTQGFEVYFIGGPDDAATGAQILQQMADRTNVHNLIGTLNLAVSAAVIGRMQLLISNDSAPLHIASALQIPVVALFCATVPEFGFGPWQVPHAVLGVEGLSCRPCGSHGGQSCPTGTHACQLQLEPLRVLAAAQRLLAETQVSHPQVQS